MRSRAPTADDARGAAVGSGLLPAPLGAEGRKRFAAATVVVWRRRFGKPVGRKRTFSSSVAPFAAGVRAMSATVCLAAPSPAGVDLEPYDAGALSFAARYGKARRWPQIQEHRNPCMKLP